MLEWILVAMCVSIMIKLADIGQRNRGMWGLVTFLVCLGAMFLIPIPLLRVGIGAVLAFIVVSVIEIASGSKPH